MYLYIYNYTYTCLYVQLFIYLYIYVFIYLYIYIYIYIYTYFYIFIYIYIYIYFFIYIHIYICMNISSRFFWNKVELYRNICLNMLIHKIFVLNLIATPKITIYNIKHTSNTQIHVHLFFKNPYFQKIDIRKNRNFMIIYMVLSILYTSHKN